jgi:hypothetical protein
MWQRQEADLVIPMLLKLLIFMNPKKPHVLRSSTFSAGVQSGRSLVRAEVLPRGQYRS